MCLFPGGLKHFLSVLTIAKEQTATFPPAGRTVRGQNKAHSDKHGAQQWGNSINKLFSSSVLVIIHSITCPWKDFFPNVHNWHSIFFWNPSSSTHLPIRITKRSSLSFGIDYLCIRYSSLLDFSTSKDRILPFHRYTSYNSNCILCI